MVRRNSDPWFRFYVRTLNNPKAQRLPGGTFKAWVNLLCLVKETDGKLPSVDDVSFRLRMSKSKTEALINTLKTSGLIDGDRMHDWDEMQYKSDSSTERVRRYRERDQEHEGNVSGNVSVTAQNRTDKKQTQKQSQNRGRDAHDTARKVLASLEHLQGANAPPRPLSENSIQHKRPDKGRILRTRPLRSDHPIR